MKRTLYDFSLFLPFVLCFWLSSPVPGTHPWHTPDFLYLYEKVRHREKRVLSLGGMKICIHELVTLWY